MNESEMEIDLKDGGNGSQRIFRPSRLPLSLCFDQGKRIFTCIWTCISSSNSTWQANSGCWAILERAQHILESSHSYFRLIRNPLLNRPRSCSTIFSPFGCPLRAGSGWSYGKHIYWICPSSSNVVALFMNVYKYNDKSDVKLAAFLATIPHANISSRLQ